MTCLSKTIWVIPRETDKRGALTLILRHDKKSTESCGRVTERRGRKSNIKSEDEKVAATMNWRCTSAFLKLQGGVKGGMRDKACSQYNFVFWEQEKNKIRNYDKDRRRVRDE